MFSAQWNVTRFFYDPVQIPAILLPPGPEEVDFFFSEPWSPIWHIIIHCLKSTAIFLWILNPFRAGILREPRVRLTHSERYRFTDFLTGPTKPPFSGSWPSSLCYSACLSTFQSHWPSLKPTNFFHTCFCTCSFAWNAFPLYYSLG